MRSVNSNIHILPDTNQYQHIHDTIIIGVARFFDARGEESHFPPLTENTKFIKSQCVIKFPLICLDVLKYVGRRNPYFLYLKDSFPTHFTAPLTLLPGATALLGHPQPKLHP